LESEPIAAFEPRHFREERMLENRFAQVAFRHGREIDPGYEHSLGGRSGNRVVGGFGRVREQDVLPVTATFVMAGPMVCVCVRMSATAAD